MTYSEKLRDPRWQRKRLEVLFRDGFKCRCCGEEKITLHVHHRRYMNGADPWEYKNEDLLTLCERCHDLVDLNIAESRGDLDFMIITRLARMAIHRYGANKVWKALYILAFGSQLLDHKIEDVWVRAKIGEKGYKLEYEI